MKEKKVFNKWVGRKSELCKALSSGLRISETASLKLTDIDSKRMTVKISQGKGGKDRYSILSQTTLEHLRQYWKKYRPTEWLFDGQKKDDHITAHTIQTIFYAAKKRARITKPASVHTLRHSFAILTSTVLSPGVVCPLTAAIGYHAVKGFSFQ